jgi:diadenosine tetraphosphate (Ap4A) HIT family hydrolase
VSKRHVVEPYELSTPERSLFWEEAMNAARVLAEVTGAAKMNYGIHGNVIPHLHLHLWMTRTTSAAALLGRVVYPQR